MSPENKEIFFKYALSQMPREACALLVFEKVYKGNHVIFCKNKSERPDQFVIDPMDYLKASKVGEIIAVLHSHVYAPATPSIPDKVACAQSGLPWHIVSVPNGDWAECLPEKKEIDLIGRPFAYGILDCYVLVQDYYKQVLGIDLKSFDHGEFGWWDKGVDNFSVSNCLLAGFKEVDIRELKEHDVLLMQIHGKAINHVAVYLGNDLILHHLNKRLSQRNVFSGYYRRHTVRVMRYGI